MPTTARQKAEARKKRGHVWQAVSAVLMALIPNIVPETPTFIVTALIVVFFAGIQAARYGYVDRPSKRTLGFILLGHAVVIALFGWWIWPRIKVSPAHVSFAGYPNETFNFSVKNKRADDVYDVQIPFLIGYNKHLDEKFSAKVVPSNEPSQPLHDDYSYCYGENNDDVKKVMPNEQEVLVVRIDHLPPGGSGTFTITYGGGEKLDTKPGNPSFISEPYSYSPTQGTIGVRGNYRICKILTSMNGKG